MSKLKLFSICFIGCVIFLSGCSQFANNTSGSVAFNTAPDSYKEAKISPDISLPKHISSNIEKQPLYLIPDLKLDNTKNNVTDNVSAVPPTLIGKIT